MLKEYRAFPRLIVECTPSPTNPLCASLDIANLDLLTAEPRGRDQGAGGDSKQQMEHEMARGLQVGGNVGTALSHRAQVPSGNNRRVSGPAPAL